MAQLDSGSQHKEKWADMTDAPLEVTSAQAMMQAMPMQGMPQMQQMQMPMQAMVMPQQMQGMQMQGMQMQAMPMMQGMQGMPQGMQMMCMPQQMQGMQGMQMMMVPQQMQGQQMMMAQPMLGAPQQMGQQQQQQMMCVMMGPNGMQGMMPAPVVPATPSASSTAQPEQNSPAAVGPPGKLAGPPGAFGGGPPGALICPPGKLKSPPAGDSASKVGSSTPGSQTTNGDVTPAMSTSADDAKKQAQLSAEALKRKLMVASMREKLKQAGPRKNTFSVTDARLRHSTFSALSLEANPGGKQEPLKRKTLAELKEDARRLRERFAEQPKVTPPAAITEEEVTEIAKQINEAETVQDVVFSLVHLMKYRNLASEEAPEEVKTFARDHEIAWVPESPSSSSPSWRCQDSPNSPELRSSKDAYKPCSESLPRLQQLERDIKSLLNKVCPENIKIIIERIAGIDVRQKEELELLIYSIFEKALAEPHYSETYADMVYALKQRMPQFASEEAGSPLTFKAAVLNACQNEFESMDAVLPTMEAAATEEELEHRQQQKNRILANMKLIGQLYVRQLLSSKVISSVITSMAKCDQKKAVPDSTMVDALCVLLGNIGHTLDSSSNGRAALVTVCDRLADLKQRKNEAGKGIYCKRIQFAIQDILEMRKANWVRKSFKETAKPLAEVRFEQEKDQSQSRGKTSAAGEKVIAGARPAWLQGTTP